MIETIQQPKGLRPVKSLYLFPAIYLSCAPVIEKYFDLEEGEIYSRTRKAKIRQARQIAMYFDNVFIRSITGKDGWSVIARKFRMDHATVIHAIKVVNQDMINRVFRKMMIEIENLLIAKTETNDQ